MPSTRQTIACSGVGTPAAFPRRTNGAGEPGQLQPAAGFEIFEHRGLAVARHADDLLQRGLDDVGR
jgi:hypothetical protein